MPGDSENNKSRDSPFNSALYKQLVLLFGKKWADRFIYIIGLWDQYRNAFFFALVFLELIVLGIDFQISGSADIKGIPLRREVLFFIFILFNSVLLLANKNNAVARLFIYAINLPLFSFLIESWKSAHQPFTIIYLILGSIIYLHSILIEALVKLSFLNRVKGLFSWNPFHSLSSAKAGWNLSWVVFGIFLLASLVPNPWWSALEPFQNAVISVVVKMDVPSATGLQIGQLTSELNNTVKSFEEFKKSLDKNNRDKLSKLISVYEKTINELSVTLEFMRKESSIKDGQLEQYKKDLAEYKLKSKNYVEIEKKAFEIQNKLVKISDLEQQINDKNQKIEDQNILIAKYEKESSLKSEITDVKSLLDKLLSGLKKGELSKGLKDIQKLNDHLNKISNALAKSTESYRDLIRKNGEMLLLLEQLQNTYTKIDSIIYEKIARIAFGDDPNNFQFLDRSSKIEVFGYAWGQSQLSIPQKQFIDSSYNNATGSAWLIIGYGNALVETPENWARSLERAREVFDYLNSKPNFDEDSLYIGWGQCNKCNEKIDSLPPVAQDLVRSAKTEKDVDYSSVIQRRVQIIRVDINEWKKDKGVLYYIKKVFGFKP